MKDQVDDLVANGIPAATLNSSMGYGEFRSIQQGLYAGQIRILYISPEKLAQETFLQSLEKLDVKLIAVDEAHCISMWGHQFRPEYRKLSVIKSRFPGVPVIALTASAIPDVREDIVRQLQLASPKKYVGSFNRNNLRYEIRSKKDSISQILDYIGENKNKSGIVYCLQKRTTEELAEKLRGAGIKALPYHADLSDSMRSLTQEQFVRDDVNVICATVAFGMGIDKPDVRFVIHYDMPKNLESYYQETGRAGRDGETSDCILFYSPADAMRLKNIIEHEYDDDRLNSIALQKWRSMMDYCETRLCRRKFLLDYFGEKYDAPGCGSCDCCWNPRDTFDGSEIASKAITCVTNLRGRFGVTHIADIVCGSNSRKILDYGHNLNPAYNTGKPYTKAQWVSFIKELVQLGYLSVTGDKYPVVSASGKSIDQAEIRLTKPASELVVMPEVDGKYDALLFQLLREARKRVADENGWPPYVVFHDTALKEMARRYPCTLQEFQAIPGVGSRKLQSYGGTFVEIIKEYVASAGIVKKDSIVDLRGSHRPAGPDIVPGAPEKNGSSTAHAEAVSNNGGGAVKTKAAKDDSTGAIEARAGLFEAAYVLQNRISQLSQDLAATKKELDDVMDEIRSSGITEDNYYRLVRLERKVRKIDARLFRELFPAEFAELATVPVAKAEKAVGSAELMKCVTYDIRESVKVERLNGADDR
jgi:ATP-dependent DNA helicase RecQ